MQPRTLLSTVHPGASTRRLTCALVLSVLIGLGCRDDVQSPGLTDASPSPALPSAASATALAFRQVSGGLDHTCAVTTDDRAYCWGQNTSGQLGDGTTTDRRRPVAVAGSLHFRNISAGANHTCAVTTDDKAYCWGFGADGKLGTGERIDHLVSPARVVGGLAFRQLSAGGFHTCGVTTTDVAYCWGDNDFGQIGRTAPLGAAAPVAVAGGLRFRNVAAGGWHTCGIGTDDRTYCWGRNTSGQVGDSSHFEFRDAPVPVAGGRRYRQVATGSSHSCAVTTDDRAFCWGDGRGGQLGNGKTYLSFWPRRVAGTLTLRRVTAGVTFTCGETTNDRAYCWGSNDQGQVGDGKGAGHRLTPSLVAGGLSFSQVSAGGVHACGRTPAAVAYCWGWNPYGQLGDGTTTDRPKPTRVVGP